MITPLEIQNKEFRRGIRGYKEDEVDEFLDKIILDYEKLYKENLELKDNLEGMHHQLEQYREIEETLKKTLIMAQNAAEDVKANAHKESELIMQETDAKVKEIIIKANNEAENTRSEYENIQSYCCHHKNSVHIGNLKIFVCHRPASGKHNNITDKQ